MRHIFFAVNFGLSLLFLACGVYCIGAMKTPFSFLGGILFSGPTAAFAIGEWVAWYRRRKDIVLILAVACLCLSGLAVFGVATNVVEALQTGWPHGFTWFVVIGSCIAGYFAFCGLMRLRSGRT